MEHIGYYLKEIFFCKKKGRLTFRYENVQKYLFFQDGFVVFAKTNCPQELLGEVLFRLGKLSDENHSKIDDYIEPKKNIGELLVEKGLISTEDLHEGLTYQMREIVLDTFSHFDGEFKFQEMDELAEQEFGSKISIPVLIEDGIRRMKYDPHLKKFMEKKTPFPKSKNFFYRLTEEEKDILKIIEGKTASEAILQSSGINPELFWKSLYLFYCLDLVDVEAEEKVPEQEKEKKDRDSEDSYKRIEEVVRLSFNLSSMNYYQILNVSETSSRSEIKKAYFQLARKYHPDLYGRDLPSDIKEKIEDVFDKITKAYHILIDEEKKHDYDAKVYSAPKEDRRDLSKRAEVRFRQGKTLYDQGKYEEALALLEEAVRLKTDKANYFLLLAMTESRIPLFARKAEQNFLKAIKLGQWSPDGYVGLGLLYKKEGLFVKAGKQFKRALNIDPENKVALKELGLEQKNVKKGLKGILSFELFGKKKK